MEKIVDYQKNEYHNVRHKELIDDKELMTAWSYFADMAYFGEVRSGMSILEFGGGLGNNLIRVSGRAKATMVEPSEIGRNYAAQLGINAIPDLASLNGELFDFILCRHVLEHVDNPLIVLRELHAALKANWQLILVVPFEKPDLRPADDDIDYHLYCWNPQTLKNLLNRAGFCVDNYWYEYYGAKRKLMPVFKHFGGGAYARLVQRVGKIFGYRELVFSASNIMQR